MHLNLCTGPIYDVGTESSKEAFYMHFDAKQEDAGKADPISDEKHPALQSDVKLLEEVFRRPTENDLICIHT